MIRELKSFEVGMCVEAGKYFYDEGKMPGGFKPEVFCRAWKAFIDTQTGVIIASFDGVSLTGGLGAVLCPDMFNGDLIAVEAFWYVIKKYRGHGIKLLLQFEQWAKRIGAKRVAMIHLELLQPEMLRKLYQSMGYKLIETHYVKELQ